MTQFVYVDNGVELSDVFRVKEAFIKETTSISNNLSLKYDSLKDTGLHNKLRNVNEFLMLFKMECNSTFGVYVYPSPNPSENGDKYIQLFPIFSNTQFEPRILEGTFSCDNEKLSFTYFQYYFANNYSVLLYDQGSEDFFRTIFLQTNVRQVQMYRLAKE